ncbi:MAG: DegT/DnrJ/EryC1/StrS family aminotransferase [candidate division KSB1 bacterium]|nr:DegT/DnrJ/EryC1/StrS family aminotransferase [candidate division KSB1 bacterium]
MPHLALIGGVPARKQPFPQWPLLRRGQLAALQAVWESGKWGIGSPFIAEFEKRFAEFQQGGYALSVCNGTASLMIALKACGVKAGDQVIVPAYTFIATASAVLAVNAVPVFVDIDPETYNLDPAQIEAAITPTTRAIMPVHIAGQPANLDAILDIARRHQLSVIEDAAQAHGAEWKGRRVGAIGDIGSFSFQSSKNMTAGEGGVLVSDDKSLIDVCFSYQNCGRVREGAWYEHRVLGYNFRLSAFQAALLTAQLATIEEDMQRRDANAQYLDARLPEIPGIRPLKTHPAVTRHSRHLYIFRYEAEAFDGLPRDRFIEALRAEGIYCHKGYTPLYREELFALDPKQYPWIEGINYREMRLPVTERASNEEAVWIPQPALLSTEKDVEDIVKAVAKIHAHVGELMARPE